MELRDFDLRACGAFVIGADEAGRGCLAGPLVAAAVRFSRQALTDRLEELAGLGDSKRMTAAARERLYPVIMQAADRVSVVSRSAVDIDAYGIQWANLNAIQAAAERVLCDRATVLVDGFKLPDAPFAHQRLVGGDNTSLSVAAASVVAKVARDRMMAAAARRWPVYGFDRHAGYATAEHKRALQEHGPCPLHRQSFANR